MSAGSCLLRCFRYPHHKYYAFDFSPTALQHLKAHAVTQSTPAVAVFEWDVVSEPQPPPDAGLPDDGLDFCLLVCVNMASPVRGRGRHGRPPKEGGGGGWRNGVSCRALCVV